MRKRMLLLLVPAAAGCTEPAGSVERCGFEPLDPGLLVLEVNEGRSGSALGRLDAEGCFRETPDQPGELGGDPVLAAAAGRVFACVRDGAIGAVVEIDPSSLTLGEPLRAGEGEEADPNPYDVAVDGDGRLWVARYNLPSLAILEPDGSRAGSVDLSSLEDERGMPRASAIVIDGGEAYVALERLRWIEPTADLPGHFEPSGPGLVAVVDVAERALASSFDLAGRNPFGRLLVAPGDAAHLWTAVPGDFYSISPEDGIARIDPAARTSELVVREDALGGSPLEVVMAGPDEGYAIGQGPGQGAGGGVDPTRVVAFDAATGEVTRVLADSAAEGEAGFAHSGLAIVGGIVAAGDRTHGSARIRLFPRAGGAELAPVETARMPPFALLPLPR